MERKEPVQKKQGPVVEVAPKKQGTVAKVEAKLQVWSARLDDLMAKCLSEGLQAHDERRRRIDKLKAKHGKVRSKFDKFKAPGVAGREGWETFKAEVARDWHDLDSAFKDMAPAADK